MAVTRRCSDSHRPRYGTVVWGLRVDSLRFLAVNYSPQLLQALNDWIIPRFEERYGVEVELQMPPGKTVSIVLSSRPLEAHRMSLSPDITRPMKKVRPTPVAA